MPTIDQLKEQESAQTPLFLFDCTLRTGAVERWGTQAVTFEGHDYLARLLRHNLFELQLASTEGFDAASKISVTLANADSRFSQIEREMGFKGAQVTIRFVFFDLESKTAASEARVVFRGVADAPDEITEAALRVTFSNRLSLQRIVLPEVSIGRRCPWLFPATAAQRGEALDGGAAGKYSALYKCGYSADQTGGVGNLNGGAPFDSCDYSRASCVERGMFDRDSASNITRRFGGVEFVPAQILVRSFGEKGSHFSPVVENQARYNDVVPLVYGTAWYQPPVVFARNDGNLTRMEVLLGLGEIEGVYKVIVNDVEIPEAVDGADMTATGWFTVVSTGARSGAFNADFTDASGNPLGDPYGSMAFASVVVPNRVSDGQTLPRIKVLANGVKLETFDSGGASLGESFTNNPAWVVLDLLRRSGWQTSEMDLTSFAAAAAYCGQSVMMTDLYGNSAPRPRYQCNLVVRNRQSAAELVKGIRAASALLLTYGADGLLTLRVENTMAVQQPQKPSGSNSQEQLDGGWPAYEFSDATAAFSGLLRLPNGDPAIRLYSKSGADTPNRLSVEFQDEFNEFQQDGLTLADVDDVLLSGRQVAGTFSGLGLPNFDQAARAMGLQLARSIKGNVFVEFETTVRGLGLTPGDLITITYAKEGLQRQPFRVVRIAPRANYKTVAITAQWHDDGWYSGAGSRASGGRRRNGASVGVPRPLVGAVVDANGIAQFGVAEKVVPDADGGFSVRLSVGFSPPSKPGSGPEIPLAGLTPQVSATGGNLAGGQTYYYALSATDAQGSESDLSFTIRAVVPAGTNTNSVTLSGLSFSPAASGFRVYRGPNPSQLLRIADVNGVAASYTDSGAPAQDIGPPDEDYDHANFYYRLELQPEVNVDIHSANIVGNSALGMLPHDFDGGVVRITRGRGLGQERAVASNTATTITVNPAWTVEPDSSSYFTVSEGTWKFAGMAAGSPVEIDVPNRPGATVQISGRSANIHDRESAYSLNPLTRWQIGGGAAGGVDGDVPPKPVFGLNPGGQGTIELVGLAFTDLANTHTITAGTLSLFYWDELNSPTSYSLAGAISDADLQITLNAAGPGAVGSLVQIEAEILEITAVASGGAEYTVARGVYGSTATTHASGSLVYHLTRSTSIIPFAKGFFGSLASGSYTHSEHMPDVRIGAAELFMTNAMGNGPAGKASWGGLVDQGLRTLSGGQIALQVEGYLAVQADAAPPLVMEESHAARDIFAVVREAPSGGPVQLRLRQGTVTYCTLTIADGATMSNVVGGFGLMPLTGGTQLSLDIVAVPSAENTLPGRDLTVTIRL
jgi:hypothetical protein